MPTPVASQTRSRWGHVKGEQTEWIRGHSGRGKPHPNHTPSIPRGTDRIAAPGYFGAHTRLRSRMGPAAEHNCVDCGGQARDWSYTHPEGYSTDTADYSPRCRPCHLTHDRRAA